MDCAQKYPLKKAGIDLSQIQQLMTSMNYFVESKTLSHAIGSSEKTIQRESQPLYMVMDHQKFDREKEESEKTIFLIEDEDSSDLRLINYWGGGREERERIWDMRFSFQLIV